MSLAEFIRAMPKAELHIHLEGAIQPDTLVELAQRYGRYQQLPFASPTIPNKSIRYTDFAQFAHYFQLSRELIRTPEDYARVTFECGRDMAQQNIRYREIHIAINQHLFDSDKGLQLEDIFAGLDNGRRLASEMYDVEIRWIFGISRGRNFSRTPPFVFEPTVANRVLGYALAMREHGVIGLGLGGSEVGAPPKPFTGIFAQAREAGLICVPHAGELAGPDGIWGAIQHLKADRICHGVRAVEDLTLVKFLAEHHIPLDICPTSNVSLQVFPTMQDHPFPYLDNQGVLVTVNSDDPTLFGSSLCDEYLILANAFGYGMADLVRIARNAFQVCGAESTLRAKLIAEFDAWAAHV